LIEYVSSFHAQRSIKRGRIGSRPSGDDHRGMKALIVLNDPPYGNERSYNGLRLANALAKREDVELRVFPMGDAGWRGARRPADSRGLLQPGAFNHELISTESAAGGCSAARLTTIASYRVISPRSLRAASLYRCL
jgi:DsrE/DsrF-like family